MKTIGWINFKLVSPTGLMEKQVEQIQNVIGYHPAGYGTYGIQQRYDDKEHNWTITWKCSDSYD